MLDEIKNFIRKLFGLDGDRQLFYVSGGEALPSPLTPAEESEALLAEFTEKYWPGEQQ